MLDYTHKSILLIYIIYRFLISILHFKNYIFYLVCIVENLKKKEGKAQHARVRVLRGVLRVACEVTGNTWERCA